MCVIKILGILFLCEISLISGNNGCSEDLPYCSQNCPEIKALQQDLNSECVVSDLTKKLIQNELDKRNCEEIESAYCCSTVDPNLIKGQGKKQQFVLFI